MAEGGASMPMVKMMIHVPKSLKVKLDSLRRNGYTASGYIRRLLEKDFRAREEAREGSETHPDFWDLTPWKSERRSRRQKGH